LSLLSQAAGRESALLEKKALLVTRKKRDVTEIQQ
jgi:hypothetical protein